MKKLARKLKKLLGKKIIDIVVFGSYAKGSIKPGDLDIAVLGNGFDKKKIKEAINKIVGLRIEL